MYPYNKLAGRWIYLPLSRRHLYEPAKLPAYVFNMNNIQNFKDHPVETIEKYYHPFFLRAIKDWLQE
jgi:hypothetical protein